MLWPETIQALKNITKSDDLVFYTPGGSPWVRTIKSIDKTGREKYTKENAVSEKFSKLLKRQVSKLQKELAFILLGGQLLFWLLNLVLHLQFSDC